MALSNSFRSITVHDGNQPVTPQNRLDDRLGHRTCPINRAEFARSLDVFPFEFGAIIDTHTVVYGPDPFDGLQVSDADLRRACEVDLKGHLLHLREAYIERHGELEGIADLVESSAPALRTLVANVVRLDSRRAPHAVVAACFHNDRQPAACESACAPLLAMLAPLTVPVEAP